MLKNVVRVCEGQGKYFIVFVCNMLLATYQKEVMLKCNIYYHQNIAHEFSSY